jgi:hypothetical protein
LAPIDRSQLVLRTVDVGRFSGEEGLVDSPLNLVHETSFQNEDSRLAW